MDRIDTSCHCVGVTPETLTIGPGEAASVTVTLDPSEAPDFRGRLGVDLIGTNRADDVLFQTRAHLTVRSVSSISPAASASGAGTDAESEGGH